MARANDKCYNITIQIAARPEVHPLDIQKALLKGFYLAKSELNQKNQLTRASIEILSCKPTLK